MKSSSRLALLAVAGLALGAVDGVTNSAQAQGQDCGVTYTVRQGDTMGAIAQRCSTSVAALLNANPSVRNPARISIGLELTVPRAASDMAEDWARGRDARAAPLLAAGRYMVESGDSLASIATKLGVELRALLAANDGIDPFSLRPGQELALPGGLEVGAPERAGGVLPDAPEQDDSVEAGGSNLEEIPPVEATADRASTSDETSRASRPSATGTEEAAGQALPTRYTVRPGDSMASIARAHGITLAALMEANPGVRPRAMRPGEELALPGGATPQPDERVTSEADAEVEAGTDAGVRETGGAADLGDPAGTEPDGAPPETSATADQEEPARYTVRPGDSLGAIATAHGVTLAALLAANEGIRPRALRPGQELTLPREAATSGDAEKSAERETAPRYVVRAGDSMAGIAAAHGVSLHELMATNEGVRPRALRPGQSLVLPGRASLEGQDAAEQESTTNSGPDGSAPGEDIGQRDSDHAAADPEVREGGSPPALEEGAAAADEPPQRMVLVGRIHKGIECPVLRTPEGVTYSLVSQAYSLTPGDYVSVDAEPVEMSFCMQGQTVRVTSMTELPSAPGR